MADGWAEFPKYRPAQLPLTSVDIGRFCGRKMGDEICEIIRGKRERCHKWRKIGRGGGNIASVSFCQLPWTSVACVSGRWWVIRKNRGGSPKCQKLKLGRGGRNIAFVSFRHPPWTSLGGRGLCGRTTEDGKLLGNGEETYGCFALFIRHGVDKINILLRRKVRPVTAARPGWRPPPVGQLGAGGACVGGKNEKGGIRQGGFKW